MEEKSLLEVDARVAKLRDLIAAGKASPEMQREIDELIMRRMALIHARVNQRQEVRPS
jgi:hypothetical protein